MPTIDEVLSVSTCEAAHEEAAGIVSIIVNAISLVIVTVIGFIAMKSMRSSTHTMNRTLTVLFVMAMVSALLALVLQIVALALCLDASHDNSQATYFIGNWPCFVMYLSILGTVLCRLCVTFDSSAYRLKNCARSALWTLYILTIIVGGTYCVIGTHFIIHSFDEISFELLLTMDICGKLFWTLFFIASIWAVYLFVRTLMKVATADTSNMSSGVCMSESVKLSKSQERYIEISSKYVSLFAIAAISSFLTYEMLKLGYLISFQVQTMTLALNHCINIQCLYYQCSFASEMYDKMCPGCMMTCCRAIITHKMKRSISKIQSVSIDEMNRDDTDSESLNLEKEDNHYTEMSGDTAGDEVTESEALIDL